MGSVERKFFCPGSHPRDYLPKHTADTASDPKWIPVRSERKAKWVGTHGSSMDKHHCAAIALRDARILAEEFQPWGTVRLTPDQTKTRFGWPIVWDCDSAHIYQPDPTRMNPYEVDVSPVTCTHEEAMKIIQDEPLTYVHLFSGSLPSQIKTMSEGLDFFPRVGGNQRYRIHSSLRTTERHGTLHSPQRSVGAPWPQPRFLTHA